MEPLRDYFPFWDALDEEQRTLLASSARRQTYARGDTVYHGGDECLGLLLVLRGQLRVFTLSDQGKELTLYRLLDRDLCLFSAACVLRGISFDISVQAEQDTEALHLPAEVYRRLMDDSAPVANYTNELMAARFSDVMWLMDQILNRKLDSRVAALLLEEAALAGSDALSLTHEQLAGHLGSAREVVTRMLKYFQSEQLVSLGRGRVCLLDRAGLNRLANGK